MTCGSAGQDDGWSGYVPPDEPEIDIEAYILEHYPATGERDSGLSFADIAKAIGVPAKRVIREGKRLEREGRLHIRTRAEVGQLHQKRIRGRGGRTPMLARRARMAREAYHRRKAEGVELNG